MIKAHNLSIKSVSFFAGHPVCLKFCNYIQYIFQGYGMVTLLVCNYAVMGNAEGWPMYKIGKGCSDCPKGTTCDQTYDSLCTGKCEEYGCQ